jgi:hypothetical protein
LKIALDKLIRTRTHLTALAELETRLPMALAIRIASNLRPLLALLEDFDKANQALIQRLGESDGEGGWRINPRNESAVNAYIQEYIAATEKVYVIPLQPITETELLGDAISLPMNLIVALDYLFELSPPSPPAPEDPADTS